MLDKIQQLKDEIQNLHVSSAAEVEDLRIKYLSKKGAISQLMNDFRTVAPELKRELGQKLNELKTWPRTASTPCAKKRPAHRRKRRPVLT